jgi:hypothetical protein
MLRSRTRLGRWTAAVTVAVAMAGIGVFVAEPVHAEPFAGLYEGFDGIPDDRWDVDTIPGQSVRIGTNTLARTNLTAAQLDASSYTNGVAKITRTISPDPNPTAGKCAIAVYLRRLAVRGEPAAAVQVSMRIRMGPATGQITSATGVTIYDTLQWSHWAFSANIAYPTSTLTLEIGAFRGIVLVDDLTVECATR